MSGVKKTVMLTGDRKAIGEYTAKLLDLDEVHTDLLPADKVSYVNDYCNKKTKGRMVCFVGDGINDAPVLARADVGIAMGGLGSDAAVEAADIVIMEDQPSKLADVIQIGRRTVQICQPEHCICNCSQSYYSCTCSSRICKYVGSRIC